MIDAITAAIGAGTGALGFGLGCWLRPFLFPKTFAVSDIAEFMSAAVNLEEAERLRRENRRRMVQSGQRTMREDGGPPAQVSRMRRRKPPRTRRAY